MCLLELVQGLALAGQDVLQHGLYRLGHGLAAAHAHLGPLGQPGGNAGAVLAQQVLHIAARAAPGKSGVQAAQLSAGQPGVQLVRKKQILSWVACPGKQVHGPRRVGTDQAHQRRNARARANQQHGAVARRQGKAGVGADKGLQRLPGLQAVQKGRAIATGEQTHANLCAAIGLAAGQRVIAR